MSSVNVLHLMSTFCIFVDSVHSIKNVFLIMLIKNNSQGRITFFQNLCTFNWKIIVYKLNKCLGNMVGMCLNVELHIPVHALVNLKFRVSITTGCRPDGWIVINFQQTTFLWHVLQSIPQYAWIIFKQQHIIRKRHNVKGKINEGGFLFEQASVQNTAKLFTCC